MRIETAGGMADSIICARAFEFAARIIPLVTRLRDRGPAARRIASELLRCGTSIGANAEEAQDGQTKPDYIAKMSVSRKRIARDALLVAPRDSRRNRHRR